jgi:4'-phosphopantetheinyl transferase
MILYTLFEKPLSDTRFSSYTDLLPVSMKERLLRFVRWQDAQASLLGKLLLLEGLKAAGAVNARLHDIRYDQYKRPYLEGGPGFNISHSGNLVACIVTTGSRQVGIDVELIRPLEIDHFRKQWNEHEWLHIITAEDECRCFYSQWTKKEAVIKADGRGLHIPLRNIHLSPYAATLEGKTWHLENINVHPHYMMHIAVNSPIAAEVIVRQLDFGE